MKHQAIFDWDRAWRTGHRLASLDLREGQMVDDARIMWALLVEAARVSRTFRAPPRTGYPSQSVMPEAPDEISQWALEMAYYRDDDARKEIDPPKNRPPLPSAAAISRTDAVLSIWHAHALVGVANWKAKRDAVYAKACRVPDRVITGRTGLIRSAVNHAKDRAVRDMLDALGRR